MTCGCNGHGGFLTAKGLKEAAQRELELDGVDAMESSDYLDSMGSLSAMTGKEVHWDEAILEDQHRRFHNGS